MQSNYTRPGSVLASRAWLFVPVLYFMQALPNVFAGDFVTILFKDLGVANVEIAKWTGLISLPYSIKLFWGPLVDLNSTKRNWVLTCQMVIAVMLVLAALVVNTAQFFPILLGICLFICIFGATTDIAMDGYYMLALPREEQKRYVGIQSTFFRLGGLFLTGLAPMLFGLLHTLAGRPEHDTRSWSIVLFIVTAVYWGGRLVLPRVLPKPEADQPLVSELAETSTQKQLMQVASVLMTGLGTYFVLSPVLKLTANFIAGDKPGLKGWVLPPAATILNIPAGTGVNAEILTLGVALFVAILGYNGVRRYIVGTETGYAFSTFVKQPGFTGIIFFCLFYRFTEALVKGMAGLFMQSKISEGGLGFDAGQVGFVNGTVGLIGIILGGIAGGWFMSNRTYKQAFLPLIICMKLPNLLYLWAAYQQPTSITVMSVVAFVDQFGYGFGFAGYATYLMWVAQRGRYATSHYAIATALGAALISTAKISGGVIQNNFGWVAVFIFGLVMAVPAVISLFLIPLPENEAK